MRNRILAGCSVALAVALGGCAVSNASAEATRTTRLQAVQSLLAAEEHVATADELNRIGPEVPDLLIRIIQDRDQDIAHRARAASYLGYYEDNATAEAFLSKLVQSPEQPKVLVRRGLVALAQVSKGKSIPAISQHLKSEDVLMREAAARALVETGDAKALQLVHDAANLEKEPFLKQRMHELAETAEQKKGSKGTNDRGKGEAATQY